MSQWGSAKARRVLAALLRIGWSFERARKAGATIIEEPAVTSYGQRRYGAEDPEGHRWYFAQETRRPKSKRKIK